MKGLFRFIATMGCLTVLSGMYGCAETMYPSLSDVAGIGGILSPEQQQQAISDLSTVQKTHGEEAAEEIEARN